MIQRPMAQRGNRAWLAWSLAAMAAALSIAGWAFAVASWRVPLPEGIFGFRGFNGIIAVAFGATGLIIALKSPANPIGWLLLAGAMFGGVSELADGYAVWAVAGHGSTAIIPRLAAVGEEWLWLAAFTPLTVVLAIFPDGRPLSRRWRLVVAGGIAGTAAAALGEALTDRTTIFASVQNPLAVHGMSEVGNAATASLLLLLAAGFANLIIRFRRGAGDEREQVKWLAASTALLVAMFALYLVESLIVGVSETSAALNLPETVMIVGLLAVPVSIAVAVLKYRLYDIDIVIRKAVVALVLAALIAGIGILLLLIVGQVGLWRGTPRGVSIAVGALLGLLVMPLLRVARRLAARITFGKRATPYEVLTEFSGRVGETYETDDVLPRMAQIVASGTGASSARVLLRVGDDMREEASFGSAGTDVEQTIPILHRGDELGAIAVTMPASDPMNPAKERLIADLAAQAGPVLQNVRLIQELRASRQRLVAAQDEERRRLERNIHDGAQQELVALAVKQRLLGNLIGRDDDKAKEMVAQLAADTNSALENLRDLARGIYPPLLADKGLIAALEAQARKATVPTTVEGHGIGRFGQDVEAAVYFSCLEALQNIAKYAAASGAAIELTDGDGSITFLVTDDGRGFDPAATGYGTGLQGIADRLAALGGELNIASEPGAGTRLRGVLPAHAEAADSQADSSRSGPNADFGM